MFRFICDVNPLGEPSWWTLLAIEFSETFASYYNLNSENSANVCTIYLMMQHAPDIAFAFLCKSVQFFEILTNAAKWVFAYENRRRYSQERASQSFYEMVFLQQELRSSSS